MSGTNGAHPGLTPTWKDSSRFVPRSFVQPMFRFMQLETAAGIVMLGSALLAFLWANSPWWEGYEHLWEHTDFVVRLGQLIEIDLTLREWVNTAAMSLFFLLVGLEIKREFVRGELRNPKAAALPAVAALGGMVVPALIYLSLNAGRPGQPGWAIPVATDIAFAVGVVTLAGRRLPLGARVFILTLAVVDDIGGILVIALFYSEDVQLGWLVVGAVTVVLTFVLKHSDVRSFAPYVVLGVVCWLSFHEAGIEPAIVGVIFGLIAPTRPFYDPRHFSPYARQLVTRVEQRYRAEPATGETVERNEHDFAELARLSLHTISPLERLENALGLWVTMVIVPVFAFANAGVRLQTDAVDTRVLLGVALGLVVGKTVGVFTFTWIGTRLGLGRLPTGVSWSNVFGLSVVAGIGFTVALFITSLSFTDAALTASAKLGVLTASLVAGALGLLALRRSRSLVSDAAPVAADQQDLPAWTPSGSSATS